MMQELGARLKDATGKEYPWSQRKIKWVFCEVGDFDFSSQFFCSCLAHVINLATQALISAYSKSSHFDPKNPEAHVPTSRDEVGLIRAIAVKVCIRPLMLFLKSWKQILIQERSSSKRKAMWKTVQSKGGIAKPVQLIIDMKVRWSSTYLMLHRAEGKKTVRTL